MACEGCEKRRAIMRKWLDEQTSFLRNLGVKVQPGDAPTPPPVKQTPPPKPKDS